MSSRGITLVVLAPVAPASFQKGETLVIDLAHQTSMHATSTYDPTFYPLPPTT